MLADPTALSPEQLAALPEDCVLAIRSGAEALCYSPGTMMLSEVKRDGEFTWQQLLEGDPNTLRVSAVVPMDPLLFAQVSI